MRNKKLFIIGALALAMAANVSAEDFTSTTVMYRVPSDYCVFIPDMITVGTMQYSLTAEKMDLCDGEHVEVSINGIDGEGNLNMYTGSGKHMVAKMRSSIGDVSAGDVIATFGNGELQPDNLFWFTHESDEGAGEYVGTVTFSVKLVQDW